MNYAELDEAEGLDDGISKELDNQHKELTGKLAHITVLGGCCCT
jgi:hypothetical protein